MSVPAEPLDPADEPGRDLYGERRPASFDLLAAGISTVIWATGFGASTEWLPPRALDDLGRPRLPGLHVIGAPWLTHRSSANLFGMARDAESLARVLADSATAPTANERRPLRRATPRIAVALVPPST